MAIYLIALLGAVTGTLTGYGAWEFATAVEGPGFSYFKATLVFISVGAVVTPCCAEVSWRTGTPLGKVIAILWMVAFVPCAATVFFSGNERAHAAKAGAKAELAAAADAVTLAAEALEAAKAKRDTAEADELRLSKLPKAPATNRAKAGTWCDDACLARAKTAAREARGLVTEQQDAVTRARAASKTESTLQLPPWLMGVSLDSICLLAFLTVSFLFGHQQAQKRAADAPCPAQQPSADGQDAVLVPSAAVQVAPQPPSADAAAQILAARRARDARRKKAKRRANRLAGRSADGGSFPLGRVLTRLN